MAPVDIPFMSLGKKTVLLFLLLGSVICLGSYLLLRLSVLPAFEMLEQQAAREGVSRVESILETDRRSLSMLNLEYSAWDETVRFMQGRKPEFLEENLVPAYWQSIGIDALIVTDAGGGLRYGWVRDPETGDTVFLDQELLTALAPGDGLVTHSSASSAVSGFLRTWLGLMIVASHPIVNSDSTGPVRGTLIIGQFLDDGAVAGIRDRAITDLSVYLIDAELPEHLATFQEHIEDPDAATVVTTAKDHVYGSRVLSDVYGMPAVILDIRQPRSITAIGVDTIRTTMLFLAAGSIGFLLAALFFMQRLIVSPIRKLSEQIKGIQDTGNLEFEAEDTRSDEVGMLSTRFGALTKDLREARTELENARDEAIAMSRAKSEFLARMSHEIRTPMNGVLGMTELLQATPLDQKQRRFAKTIYASAETLLHIINDILDISKIEAGKLELDIAPFNLRDLVEECLEMIADSAHRKGLELVNLIPGDAHVAVEGDGLRIRQVLINLLSNAVKFTDEGEIIIRVFEQGGDADRAGYRFEVRDTGIGIDPANVRKIFDPFTQEDGGATRRFGGTGLGLSICRQLVELMGGVIGVQHNAEGGSTFWFELSLPRDEDVPEEDRAELLAGSRILVVDDNHTNREALESQLESWHVEVVSASSAPEALGIFTQHVRKGQPFDAVLLDMYMPGMDGAMLAESIRGMVGGGDVPLIMLSSVSAADATSGQDPEDIDAWITKPVRQSRLIDALASHLHRSGRRQADLHLSPSADAANDALGSTPNILLVEDNPVNQAVAIGMIKSLGYSPAVANDGREGVERFKQADFDLVLMDCQMPEVDGFEATELIRDWEAANNREPARIVALTANALTGDRERCLAAGMDDYVSKPFTRETLQKVIEGRTADRSNLGRAHSA